MSKYTEIHPNGQREMCIRDSDKRVLRICRKLNIKSTIKYSNNGCTRQAANPQYIAENILNREFTAKAPNEKWLTDVTEFHYYIGIEKHKVYLSAILLSLIHIFAVEQFHKIQIILPHCPNQRKDFPGPIITPRKAQHTFCLLYTSSVDRQQHSLYPL